jgi:glycosyltransferase involved in cell wall biosynthesis
LRRLYHRADILLNIRLTSALRTPYFFPSKLIEYMATGTPVVSTCTGHVKEEFGRFVYLLEDETASGLAGLLRRIRAEDPRRRLELGLEARRYVREHKTWRAQTERVLDFVFSHLRS